MAETGQKLECDLVMRGGITSGIVYTCAIAKLAETYRFRSIGGTSAGAIAAAATAAGALGVREGNKLGLRALLASRHGIRHEIDSEGRTRRDRRIEKMDREIARQPPVGE